MADEISTNDVQSLEWWTPREVANRFRVDVSTIVRQLNQKNIRGSKLGKLWRIHVSEVQRIGADGLPRTAPQHGGDAKATADEWNAAPDYV